MCKDIITKKINYIFQFFIEYGANRSASGGERLEHELLRLPSPEFPRSPAPSATGRSRCERSEQKLFRLTSTEFPRKTSATARSKCSSNSFDYVYGVPSENFGFCYAYASVFLQNEFTQTQQYSFFESSSSYS